MPLPMPRSVICSPSHIRNMVPAVRPTTDENTKPIPGVYTTGAPPAATWPCKATAMPKDWNAASSTVA
ncbi:hypothetical protein RLIN73S_02178 [Rhodanobacter lindaniclasticus]